MVEIIFWLLFILSQKNFDNPIGAYTTKDKCIKGGNRIEAVTARKYECKPVAKSALHYYGKQCLGDAKAAHKILGKHCGEKSKPDKNNLSIPFRDMEQFYQTESEKKAFWNRLILLFEAYKGK
jgi:hypothetical protein|tara:strand:- start:405 stop:773 length:369 start_codon:yes stop_codon:yes gene_type:complete